MPDKLYILTYRTLPIGYGAIQCSHALREWIEAHPEEDKNWYKTNNSIILLTASDLKEFRKILAKADAARITYSKFLEPDMAYQETAACFTPSPEARKLLKHCQLLGGPTQKKEDPKTVLDYKLLMKTEKQGSSGISLWQHGEDCQEAFLQIIDGERFGCLNQIGWLDDAIIELKDRYGDPSTSTDRWRDILTYIKFHDIGKIHSKIIDEEGRIHYPEHAEISAKTWIKIGGSEAIANLMRKDMAMHSMTKEECHSFLTYEELAILRISALAEIISNARNGLFGPLSFEETSFKIKLKKIKRNGSKQLI